MKEMKLLALKCHLNIYLLGRVGWILRKFESNAKQLQAEIDNGVAYKKRVLDFPGR